MERSEILKSADILIVVTPLLEEDWANVKNVHTIITHTQLESKDDAIFISENLPNCTVYCPSMLPIKDSLSESINSTQKLNKLHLYKAFSEAIKTLNRSCKT